MLDAEFALPEQRHQVRVTGGGRGSIHIVRYSTFIGRAGGRWTRKAAARRALCGSLGATLIGIDAATWATQEPAVTDAELQDVTCRRCKERYANWLKKAAK